MGVLQCNRLSVVQTLTGRALTLSHRSSPTRTPLPTYELNTRDQVSLVARFCPTPGLQGADRVLAAQPGPHMREASSRCGWCLARTTPLLLQRVRACTSLEVMPSLPAIQGHAQNTAPHTGIFVTKIFHPNVSKAGEICVNTLKRDWTPSTGLRHILVVVRCLLIEPNPESALNEEAGRLLLEDYKEYAQRAQLMTSIHAQPPRRCVFCPLSLRGQC